MDDRLKEVLVQTITSILISIFKSLSLSLTKCKTSDTHTHLLFFIEMREEEEKEKVSSTINGRTCCTLLPCTMKIKQRRKIFIKCCSLSLSRLRRIRLISVIVHRRKRTMNCVLSFEDRCNQLP